jgi:hypothetical protein
MLWFKHAHDLRNSPAMKYIQRRLGDEGYAAAMRLIEVLTYRSGSGTRFNPVLALAVPTTITWLAQELLTYDPERQFDADGNLDGDAETLLDRIDRFLKVFETAGLIELGSLDGHVVGKPEEKTKITTIKLVEFEEFMDVWTARKTKNAQSDAA